MVGMWEEFAIIFGRRLAAVERVDEEEGIVAGDDTAAGPMKLIRCDLICNRIFKHYTKLKNNSVGKP